VIIKESVEVSRVLIDGTVVVLSYILVVLVGDVAVADSVVDCILFSVLISALFVNDLVVLTWVDDCTLLLNSFS